MTPRPFRFGLVVYGSPADVSAWRALARRAEALGYDTLLLGDHFDVFLPLGGAAPMLALADAAAATTSLRVGTAMLGNDYRHPAIVAREAATIDLLSNGRFELGLGAGWLRSDYDSLGIPYDSVGTRVDRLAEAIRLTRLAWSGERFAFSGEHYSISNYRGLPLPTQQPHPPILVGGGSERVLRTAGSLADIVGIHVSTMRDESIGRAADESELRLYRKLEWVRSGAQERVSTLELQMAVFTLIVSPSPQTALEDAARARGVTPSEITSSVMSLVGTAESVCEELERRREAWGVSYFTVNADMCQAFAPIVSRLAGK